MSWNGYWFYLTAVALLCASPGPNMLLTMRTSATAGLRAGAAVAAGCLTGTLSVLAASAAGLAVLLEAWPRVFGALRLAGVAYLIWLGVQAWRHAGGGGVGRAAPSGWRGWRIGLATGLSNPKAILFAAAFLPQFVDAHRPQAPQFAILVATFGACDAVCYVGYAAGGRSLARALGRPHLRRLFDRATGAMFVAFAAAIVSARA